MKKYILSILKVMCIVVILFVDFCYANLLFKIMNYDRKTYKETQKRIVSLCRKNVVKCCCSPYMKINDKVKIILISLNKSIYPFFYKIAIKKNMKGENYDS